MSYSEKDIEALVKELSMDQDPTYKELQGLLVRDSSQRQAMKSLKSSVCRMRETIIDDTHALGLVQADVGRLKRDRADHRPALALPGPDGLGGLDDGGDGGDEDMYGDSEDGGDNDHRPPVLIGEEEAAEEEQKHDRRRAASKRGGDRMAAAAGELARLEAAQASHVRPGRERSRERVPSPDSQARVPTPSSRVIISANGGSRPTSSRAPSRPGSSSSRPQASTAMRAAEAELERAEEASKTSSKAASKRGGAGKDARSMKRSSSRSSGLYDDFAFKASSPTAKSSKDKSKTKSKSKYAVSGEQRAGDICTPRKSRVDSLLARARMIVSTDDPESAAAPLALAEDGGRKRPVDPEEKRARLEEEAAVREAENGSDAQADPRGAGRRQGPPVGSPPSSRPSSRASNRSMAVAGAAPGLRPKPPKGRDRDLTGSAAPAPFGKAGTGAGAGARKGKAVPVRQGQPKAFKVSRMRRNLENARTL